MYDSSPLTGQLKMYFIIPFKVWRGAGLRLTANTFERASRGKNCATGTSLFIFTVFLESFGERGKTGMFMKVSRWSHLHPQLFFAVLGP